MKKYFQLSRIRLNDLYSDTIDYVSGVFKASGITFAITSPFGMLISVINQMSQLIFFYIEDSIQEIFIGTATRPSSIYGISRLTGHNPTRAISATGLISIGYNGKDNEIPNGIVIIPNHSYIKCSKNGLTYFLDLPQTDIRVPLVKNKTFDASIIQGTWETQTFTGDGNSLQSYVVNMKGNKLIENFNVRVYVNSQSWKIYDSLYDMPFNAQGVLVKTGITSGLDIQFGNMFNGKIPDIGSEIRVEYLITDGVRGDLDIDNNIKWTWVDVGYDQFGNEVDLNSVLNIKLSLPCDFSSNPEDPNLTKLLAPKVSRSLILARPENYIYFFEKYNLFSVIDAWTTVNDNDLTDDNVIYLFLIPDVSKKIDSSENYFTTQLDDFFLTSNNKNKILQLLDDSEQTLACSVPVIVDPIIKKYIVHISLIIYDKFNDDSIKEEIVSKLSDYFIKVRRRDRIPKSDLITIIEGIQGVDSVNLYFLSEENELLQKNNPSLNLPDIGTDDFGDIIMANEELVLMRGGFTDRNGIFYKDGIDFKNPSSVNINISKRIPYDHNAQINSMNKNNLIG